MSPGIHVLCVDDDPDIRSLTATALERADDALKVTTAGCGREALERVRDGPDDPDCIVSDYEMPGLDGLELLEAIREHDPALPFILVTAKGSEAIASEAISAGVTDYIRKSRGMEQYSVLANRIVHAVERRRADRARRESERERERYRTLVEAVDDPMYVLDETGHCTVANEAFCDLLGVERDRLVGEHVAEFLSRESFERGVKAVRHLYRTGGESDRFEVTVGSDDGERWVGEANVTALTNDDGEFAGSTAVIRDITDRKRRERELAQYERIIELAPIALFVLDANATITWFNDEFADEFTESADELLGLPFPDLIDRGYYDDDVTAKYTGEVRALLSSAIDRERAKYYVRFQPPDGEERIHDVHTKLLPLEDGAFTGTIHAIRDITERRRSQRELERQNERLEQFASVVSHDLRNPLNVAQGTLELHAEDCPLEASDGDVGTGEGPLERVRWSLERMDELIEDLLSLARHGRAVGDPEPVSLPRLVRDAWDVVDTGDATLECSAEATIRADETRLRALLENLFRNAVEHGPTSRSERRGEGDGATTVSVGLLEGDSDGEGDVSAGADGDADAAALDGFFVEDDGSGLPETDAIFEFGYTTADDGTGFGLGIVAEIATAHGWHLEARDGRDGGARFEFRDVAFLEDGSALE